MDSQHDLLERTLAELVGDVEAVTRVARVDGGCISNAMRVEVVGRDRRPRVLFVKQNDESFAENFECERDGLLRLLKPGVIGVPKPVASGIAHGSAWLVTEWIEQGTRQRDFFARFGRLLAELHRGTAGTEIGLDRDNFLGSARQCNGLHKSWADFVAENRIGYQVRWATDQGHADSSLKRDCEQIIDRMDRLLDGRDEATSLLHGDLWSGNYLCDDRGEPVIIDPAVYYGCREAEFGMIRLFGSCPGEFDEAYQDAYPMPDGWQRRVSVYVLYHLLNHLNLFGSGYLSRSQALATEILRSSN